jgi:predicted nucleic-acid-binding protein
MDVTKNLFKVRKKKNYDVRKYILDDRKNVGNVYRENVLLNSLSRYIQRNPSLSDFLIMVQHAVADIIDSVSYLRSYKSFTLKKDDKKVK